MILIPFLLIGFLSYTVASSEVSVAIPDPVAQQTQTDSHAYVVQMLGAPLPGGVEVIGVVHQGTPIDTVQIKLRVPLWALAEVNALFNVQVDAQENVAPNPFPSDHSWWDLHTHDSVLRAAATFGDFDQVTAFTAPDPDPDPDGPADAVIYILAHRL